MSKGMLAATVYVVGVACLAIGFGYQNTWTHGIVTVGIGCIAFAWALPLWTGFK